jgi:ethanolamine utilization protein EutN
MITGRVLGTATSTVKHPSMEGWKLLVVQPLDNDGKPKGDPVLAVDMLGAGTEENVILTSDGKTARALLDDNTTPVRWSVVGLPD